jgi:hypothetical protein
MRQKQRLNNMMAKAMGPSAPATMPASMTPGARGLGNAFPRGIGGMAGGIRPAGPMPRPSGMFKNGGSVGSASKRADGCAVKGKTRGKIV